MYACDGMWNCLNVGRVVICLDMDYIIFLLNANDVMVLVGCRLYDSFVHKQIM